MKLTPANTLMQNGDVIRGRWVLNPSHEFQYKADPATEEAILTATVLAFEPEGLVLTIKTKESRRKTVSQLLKLSGTWQTNSRNQLAFHVARESGREDILTFGGRWEINRNHEIVYAYKQQRLKRRVKKVHSFVLKGHWEITEGNRLTYWVGGDSESALRFRGAFETASIRAKKGQIRYRLGIEVQGKKRQKILILFGEWKLSGQLELSFEIEYSQSRRHAIHFGAEYALTKDLKIEARLKTTEGEPLGLELMITKDLFRDQGEAFLRLRKSLEESSVEAGVRIPW